MADVMPPEHKLALRIGKLRGAIRDAIADLHFLGRRKLSPDFKDIVHAIADDLEQALAEDKK